MTWVYSKHMDTCTDTICHEDNRFIKQRLGIYTGEMDGGNKLEDVGGAEYHNPWY